MAAFSGAFVIFGVGFTVTVKFSGLPEQVLVEGVME